MPDDRPKKLTDKQKRFVAEYAADPNAVQAYFRAFGRITSRGVRRSYHGASRAAQRLLKIDSIKSELDAAIREHARRCGVSARRTIREIAAIAYADPDDIYGPDPTTGFPVPRPWKDIPPAARKVIASVKVKRNRRVNGDEEWEYEELEYRTHSKDAALDKLCRRLNLYRDIPPLEVILGAITPELAAAVRAELAAAVRAGGSPGNAGPEHTEPVRTLPQ